MAKHIVALASTDGKVINQHFGHAERFHVVELDEAGFHYLESRDTAACCQDFSHSESSFDAVIGLLKGCEAVFVSKIGIGAAGYLISKGLRVFEAPVIIDDVLQKVIQEKLLEQKEGA